MADTVIITGEKTVTVVTVGVQGPAGISGSSIPATNTTLGGIIVGDNLTITGNGVLSAQPGGVTAFNNRTGNVSLTSNDVTTALTYTPLTATTSYSNLSFTGTSSAVPFNFKVSNANGSRYASLSSPSSGLVDMAWVINNTRANGQTDTYYPFMRLYTDPLNPDINEGTLYLQYNYTANASTGPYFNTSVRISKNKAEFFAQTYTWTDNSLLIRSYADTRYATFDTISGLMAVDSSLAININSLDGRLTNLEPLVDLKLPSANFTYANLTGTPTTLAGYGITDGLTSANLTPYLTISSANSTYSVLGHTHAIANVTGLQTALDAKLPSANFTYANLTGPQNLLDTELIRAKLRDYSETVSSPTISAGTLVLNLETSNIFTVSLNAAITTLTISNPPASGSGGSFTLIFTADGTARAVTWPASIKWAGGTAPTITSTSGKVDSFAFFTSDGGTNWQGYVGGQNF